MYKKNSKSNRKHPKTVGKKELHNRLLGHVINPAAQPNTIIETPWNQIVLQLGFAGDKTVKIVDIITTLKNQTGFTNLAVADFKVEIRTFKVRVWALSSSRPMELTVFGFTGTSDARQKIISWPKPMQLPRCGWEWCDAIKTGSFNETSQEILFSVDVGKVDNVDIPWLAYLDMAWRGRSDTPISQGASFDFRVQMNTLSRRVANVTLSLPSTSSN